MAPSGPLDADAVQFGHFIDALTGGVVPPVQPSVTFARGDDGELLGDHVYSRYGMPAWDGVEALAARLDGGADARLFASGLAAVAAVVDTVPQGGHIVAPEVMYHGAQDWMRRMHERRGLGLTLFDATDPGALAAAVRSGETDLVWIETPVNPTWDVIDIEAAADVAHRAGAVLAVDVTVAPLTTRPIELGADLVMHAATKYYNGHSDVTAGLLVTAEVNERWVDIDLVRRLSGGILGPFEAWLLQRGMRTLPLRVERASASALAIAEHLHQHPAVHTVRYPGLASHPGHEVAKRQMDRGYGAMLSFQVDGGFAAAERVAAGTELFVCATSLGGVESLIEHRRRVEGPHSEVPEDLLRLSVGIEPVEVLTADLDQAIAAATGGR